MIFALAEAGGADTLAFEEIVAGPEEEEEEDDDEENDDDDDDDDTDCWDNEDKDSFAGVSEDGVEDATDASTCFCSSFSITLCCRRTVSCTSTSALWSSAAENSG